MYLILKIAAGVFLGLALWDRRAQLADPEFTASSVLWVLGFVFFLALLAYGKIAFLKIKRLIKSYLLVRRLVRLECLDPKFFHVIFTHLNDEFNHGEFKSIDEISTLIANRKKKGYEVTSEQTEISEVIFSIIQEFKYSVRSEG